jgi:hypothetical protein
MKLLADKSERSASCQLRYDHYFFYFVGPGKTESSGFRAEPFNSNSPEEVAVQLLFL